MEKNVKIDAVHETKSRSRWDCFNDLSPFKDDHCIKRCQKVKHFLIDIIAGLLILIIYIILSIDLWKGLTIPIFSLLGILSFIFGCCVGELFQHFNNQHERSLRIFTDITIGIIFITLFYVAKPSNDFVSSLPAQIAVFILGFLFGDLIGGIYQVLSQIKKLEDTTEKMYMKVVAELMEMHLSGYLSESKNRDIFRGLQSIGICKEATVGFSQYDSIATRFLSNAKFSIYSTHVIPPKYLITENYKSFFNELTNSKVKKKRVILVPFKTELYDWTGQNGEDINNINRDDVKTKIDTHSTIFKRFVLEWLQYHNSEYNVDVRVFADYLRDYNFFYGDILVIDEHIALSFNLYECFKEDGEALNLGSLQIICGDIVKEYLKIFNDEEFEEIDKPEKIFKKWFPNAGEFTLKSTDINTI